MYFGSTAHTLLSDEEWRHKCHGAGGAEGGAQGSGLTCRENASKNNDVPEEFSC